MASYSEFNSLPEYFDDFSYTNEAPSPNPEESSYVEYGLKIEDSSSNINMHNNYAFPQSPDLGSLVESSNDSAEIECLNDHESDSVFKFLDQILMEDRMEEKPSMFHDPLGLQATEKSFYEVIDKKYPPSPSIDHPTHFDRITECPKSLCEVTCETNDISVDASRSGDPGGYEFHPSNGSYQSPFTCTQSFVHSVNSSRHNSEGQVDSFMNMNLIPSLFSDDNESVPHLWKGMEDTRKFLHTNDDLVGLDKYTLTPNPEKEPTEVDVRVKKDQSPSTRGMKHLHRQDSDLDTRSRKQTAIFEDEVELSDLFDKVLLRDVEGVRVSSKGYVKYLNGIDKCSQQNRLPQIPRNEKAPNKKKGKESDFVDLQSYLVRCAQATASGDLQTAREQLNHVRKYASSTGDADQRTANVFANGLEACIAGTGTEIYAALASKRITATQKLKAYQVYLSACPFKEISVLFSNKMILKIAAKASTLHIVDFGINYGFQWPVLIQFLSIRRGGPPRLRITGIDFPQAGFRPAELIEQTGQRLAKYCKRFNVPFEYHAIAKQRWDEIDINDLKLARDEVLVVNCLLQFKNVPDETMVEESPKDGVMKLIRRMKPDMFIHTIVNGSYNAPFFLTRFREAFFYYSSLFNMLDVTLPSDNLQRLHFEKEFYGREVVNIIACEGQQRVERPETYKQWQIRSMRSGFKILPLDKEIIQKLKGKVEADFHKDFLVDEDCNWLLQGWKGRVLYGSSCWVPV